MAVAADQDGQQSPYLGPYWFGSGGPFFLCKAGSFCTASLTWLKERTLARGNTALWSGRKTHSKLTSSESRVKYDFGLSDV